MARFAAIGGGGEVRIDVRTGGGRDVNPPRLSVIVVTYRGAECVRACLRSVLRFTNDAEIIVVDNASNDGTVALVQSEFADVHVVRSQTNVGFGAGCHLGVDASSGEYYLFLNQDAVLTAPLDGFVSVMHRDDRLGILGGHVSYPNGRLQPTLGRPWSPFRLAASWLVPATFPFVGHSLARVVMRRESYDREQRGLAWVSGAFLLSRGAAWNRVGGFDPAYFMYVEDMDYADRVRQAGFDVGYSPLGRAAHAERGHVPLGEAVLRWTSDGYVRLLDRTHGTGVSRRFARRLGWVFRIDAAVLAVVARFTGSERRRVTSAALATVGRELSR